MTLPVVVVGSQDDLHVAAVVADLAGIDPLLIDVARLADVEFGVSPNCVEITVDDRTFDLSRGWRGWIRRLSPADWEQGVIIGSHDASAMAAWLSLLAALLRHPEACWLSDLDSMNAAENKITQYIAAQRLGLLVPSTVVTNSVERAAACGTDLIAKPLGPGHYRTQDGEWRTVFTDAFDPRGPDGDLLGGPPFIVQQRLPARAHKRVVTVAERAWVFSLDGADLPVDWRQEARAHREWEPEPDSRLAAEALALARYLKVGYSSQDWIETDQGCQFIDLNPAGQWLFLPDPAAAEISAAIASWVSDS